MDADSSPGVDKSLAVTTHGLHISAVCVCIYAVILINMYGAYEWVLIGLVLLCSRRYRDSYQNLDQTRLSTVAKYIED